MEVKRFVTVFLSCLLFLSLKGQELRLLSNSGSSGVSSNLNYSYSIGELVINQDNIRYLSGFQQYINDSLIVNKPNVTSINTIITPNGDGLNDYLEIDNIPLNSTLNVFDKWGNILFKSNFLNSSWSGIDKNGRDLPDGVYVFLILQNASNVCAKGTITIKRK